MSVRVAPVTPAELSADDQERPARPLSGIPERVVAVGAFALAVLALWQVFRPLPQGSQYYLVLFLAGALPLVFVSYRSGARWLDRRAGPGPLDWALAVVALVVCLYPVLPWAIGTGGGGYDAFLDRQGLLEPVDVVMGAVLLLLILEACRRTTGWVLPGVCLLFLAYGYYGGLLPQHWTIAHAGLNFDQIVDALYNSGSGFYGTPLDVAATYIVLFTIYGAALEFSGAAQYFVDLSVALFRRSRSAAGRTAVASGFLLGTVSGSGTATAVSVGAVTWPILRRAGYRPEQGAGLLAAAGVGAILSPPTLGVAAFIVAEYLNVSYLTVLGWATIPTLLYYLGILLAVEIDARRLLASGALRDPGNAAPAPHSAHEPGDTPGAPRSAHDPTTAPAAPRSAHDPTIAPAAPPRSAHDPTIAPAAPPRSAHDPIIAPAAPPRSAHDPIITPAAPPRSVWKLLGLFGYHFLSLIAIVVLLLIGVSATRAVVYATVLTFVLAVADRLVRRRISPAETRISVGGFGTGLLRTLSAGVRSALPVVAVCAAAGVITAMTTKTGLGAQLASLLIEVGSALSDNASVVLACTVVLAAVALALLGLAVPVTASFVIGWAIIGPALIQLGVPAPAVAMFTFYYSVLSEVTPPTALAAVGASAITGARAVAAMWQALRYALPAFLVPVVFVLTDSGEHLLGRGAVLDVLAVSAVTALAVAALAVATGGWMYGIGPAGPAARILAAAAGLTLLYPSPFTAAAGSGLLAGSAAVALLTRRRSANRVFPAGGE
ncbi:TRAP transporter fused permease subunit [Nocardia mexicana]|uniref:TRAP transporter 4TM/12TM fusion protein n=1 Tax=Nocardia mexicana TaxID=279262 RepID=A0A370HBS8_9NOCA|nr:TRAP transporter fused permease subunit [Nocardia mexicana]RDI54368.1 TRAP transporter 4TM/12TM fusion protein [Nocardia mexicana]